MTSLADPYTPSELLAFLLKKETERLPEAAGETELNNKDNDNDNKRKTPL